MVRPSFLARRRRRDRGMTSQRLSKHIGIVGGGIAGLTAAYRLAQAGHRVTLWERAPRLGGQAAAFPVAGTSLEHFYHHLFQSDREIVALIEELGIGDHLVWLPSNVGYFADGKIYPLNGAHDLLKLGIIPLPRPGAARPRHRLSATSQGLAEVRAGHRRRVADAGARKARLRRAPSAPSSTRSSGATTTRSRWSGSGARSGCAPPRAVAARPGEARLHPTAASTS